MATIRSVIYPHFACVFYIMTRTLGRKRLISLFFAHKNACVTRFARRLILVEQPLLAH